jgi:DNA repair exonuclease SbcCD ATPase subunit
MVSKLNDKEKYHNDFATYEDTQNDIDELKETLAQLEEALEQMDEEDENYDDISKAYQELQDELDKLEEELFAQKEALDEMESSFEEDGIETEYEEMKSAYEDFENEYEHIKEEFESKLSITDEDKQELKKLYKKAARLCHPDIVADELKDKAHALMQQLNDAYSKMDLVAIKEMLKSLENGISFLVASDSINDKELLKAKIDELKEKIQAIKEEIEQIQSDETYQVIQKLDDWDGYFEELKTTLETEKERLEKEASVVSHGNDLFEESDFYDNALHAEDDGIAKEESPYARHIKSIENPSFEKIRRYCNNLVDDHKADEMQKYLAENGKMHKALMYDALEQFLEKLDGDTIALIDWGCGQGIGSMLVLDYIREKQLDIKIEQVLLIDSNKEKLSRSMLQLEALAKNHAQITAVKND